jgi:hypothetical protein
MSHLHVWAVVRLLPDMQRVVLSRFRRRGEAENYVYVLRRQLQEARLEIVFDPPSDTIHSDAHSNNLEMSSESSSSSKSSAND